MSENQINSYFTAKLTKTKWPNSGPLFLINYLNFNQMGKFYSLFLSLILLLSAGVASATCGSLDGVYFYDSATNQSAYGPINNGDVIDLSNLPDSYYLVAETSGYSESVTWLVDNYPHTENVIPYTFPGGAENEGSWQGGAGHHNLIVSMHQVL